MAYVVAPRAGALLGADPERSSLTHSGMTIGGRAATAPPSGTRGEAPRGSLPRALGRADLGSEDLPELGGEFADVLAQPFGIWMGEE